MVDPGVFVRATGLLARAAPWDPRLLWYSLGLVGLLLLGAYAIWLTDRWRKQNQQSQSDSSDQLAHFRTLYERGEFSAEEFARIRGLLTGRMMKDLEKSPIEESARPASAEPPTDAVS